jgi:hypothetical protein
MDSGERLEQNHVSLSGSNSAVECQLPKLDVAGSIPVSRSMFSITWESLIISGLVRLVR